MANDIRQSKTSYYAINERKRKEFKECLLQLKLLHGEMIDARLAQQWKRLVNISSK